MRGIKNRKPRFNRLSVIFTILTLVMLVGITFAFLFYEGGNREELDIAVIELTSNIDGVTDLDGILSGRTIINSSSFSKAANSETCYVRATFMFGSTATNLTRQEQNYIFALNSVDYSDGVSTGVAGTKWLSENNGYYYLVNNSDQLFEVTNTTTYNFVNNLKLPALLDLIGEGFEIDSGVEGLYFDIKFQAIQSKYLPANDFDGITEIFDMVFGSNNASEYLVRFNTNNILRIPPQIVAAGGKANNVQIESSDYYVFSGWYSDSEYTTEFDFNSPITSNTIIYGKIIDGYTVTYMNPDHITINSQDKVELDNPYVAIPSVTSFTSDAGTTSGYVDGWYVDSTLTNEFDFSESIASDITLYPKLLLVSTGLSYSYSSSTQSYSVSKGSCSDNYVVIPKMYNNKPVTAISSNGFKNATNITNVLLPSGITSIGEYAFDGCTSLPSNDNVYYLPIEKTGNNAVVSVKNTSITTVDWPENVVMIADRVFRNCSNLELTELPSGITSIGNYAFYGCNKLALTSLPSGMISIGNYAFYNCSKITLTELPSGITSIGNYTFMYCSKLALTSLPSGIVRIGYYAFYNCTNLLLSSLPSGITYMGSCAFSYCTNITLSKLPDGITSIESSIFDGCSNITLTSLPSGITYIGSSAFSNCSKITLASLPSGITAIDQSAFRGCSNITLSTLPSGLTRIGNAAFDGCSKLALTSLPSGITSIGWDTFKNCSNLALTSLSNGITSIDTGAFYGCTKFPSNDTVYYLPIAGTGNVIVTMAKNTSITTVNWPANVTMIVGNAFQNCTSLTSISLPNGITSIEGYTFSGCTNLATISIPSGVTNIGKEAFRNCTNLALTSLPSGIATIDNDAFDGCTSLPSNDTIYYLPIEGTGNNAVLAAKNTSITTVDWPANVTMIAGGVFSNCKSLVLSELPSGLTYIGPYAFYDCTLLAITSIPSGITSLYNYTFYRCTSLVLLSLPSGLTNIDSYSIYNCTSLKYVLCPTDEVANVARYRVSNANIYTLQANGYASGTSETEVVINGNMTIYTATVSNVKWVRTSDNKYYKLKY